MHLKLKHNRYFESTLKTSHFPTKITDPLPDIHQDDPQIAHLIMEQSSYKKYGCRVIGLYRCVLYQLRKLGIPGFSAEENDKIIDAGGELRDCWLDNIQNPVYDILDAPRYVKRINQKFSTPLTYHIYKQNELGKKLFYETLSKHLRNNTPVVIKMRGLFGGFHFVNVTGCLSHENGNGYLLMKETYRRYKGYNEKWCESGKPIYAEVIA